MGLRLMFALLDVVATVHANTDGTWPARPDVDGPVLWDPRPEPGAAVATETTPQDPRFDDVFGPLS